MNTALIRIILLASLLELGIQLSDNQELPSDALWSRLSVMSKRVVRIDWKPISVFPEDTKRF